MEKLHLALANVHCEDCERAIQKALSRYLFVKRIHTAAPDEDATDKILYRIDGNDVELWYDNTDSSVTSILKHSIKKIVKSITKHGFEVVSWEFFEDGEEVLSSRTDAASQEPELLAGFLDVFKLWSNFQERRSKREHLKNCKTCADEEDYKNQKLVGVDSDSNGSFETVVEKPAQEFRAVFSVSGMTCSSCVGSVSETIQSVLGLNKSESEEEAYSVDLIQHTAVVIIPNKQIVNKIIHAVNETGFECRLLEVLPVERSINVKITAMIGGITCAACANSIQSAVNELPFVLQTGVNIVTKSAVFVMEESKNDKIDHVEKLKETVEDCGFDFQLLKRESINYTSGKKRSRSINVSVEGMYCGNCPDLIMDYLNSFGEAIVIEDPITLKHPFIKFTYIPNQEKKITIRRLLFDLNHLQPTEESYKIDASKQGIFECNLVESVSMDEHLRKLAKSEIMKIIRRLVIAFLFAIPTFIFGVVAMSLLPKHNKLRVWVEDPIWAGNVSRNTWILFILSTPVYFFATDIFHTKAIKEVYLLWRHKNSFKRRLLRFGSMNLLVSLGTTVAYITSIVLIGLGTQQERDTMHGLHTTYFDSVVFLTFFLLIGKLLEAVSKSKTADAIADLGKLKVSQATLFEPINNEFGASKENDHVVDVKYLEADDLIVIGTGESPPVDCIVVDGASEFDESALTGESTPVKHAPGEQIFSGTVNIGNHSIVAKILSLEGDSLIDQIVSTVRDGQLRKAPIARTADALTGYFVPIIVVLAILTWVIWLSLGLSGSLPESYLDIDIGGWTVWSLEFSIAVFVIACPCGLGLAAPTALFVGSGLAAKHGILAKGGGVAFQDGANTGVVCFDKTGTLTYGELKVTDFAFVLNGEADEEKQTAIKAFSTQVVRDLELSSKHPLAKAVKAFIDNYHGFQNELKPMQNKVPQVESAAGKGLKGTVVLDHESGDLWNKYKPSEAILGNEALIKDYGIEITSEQQELLKKWKTECKSVILVAIKSSSLYDDNDFHLVQLIACRDQIRKDAKIVIDYLQKHLHIECWMISGDNKITADAIGAEIGIAADNIISEVLPDEKQNRVKMIQKLKNKVVAMVGDGINDAPALALADVGIALASGADLAVTSSDFILLNKSYPLLTLVTLFHLSKVVFRRVKFNFGWSLIYNMIGLPIAAGVIYPYNNSRLDPVWASAAMALSSVSVVGSSLALKLYRPKFKAEDIKELDGQEDAIEKDVTEVVLG